MAQHPAVRQVLATAAAEIGYSRWKDDQQGTKYARETQPVFWPRDFWLLANGISFCDIFVTWVFWKALGEDFVTDGGLPAGASYNTDYRASKGGRVAKSRAQPGDVLVFDWNWGTLSTNHVGILEKNLKSGNYQTLEGNTSPGASGSQGNGGGVYRRVRRPGQVRYVIRPNWSKASGPSSGSAKDSARPWRTSPRVQGMSAAAVKALQQDLAGAGYNLGSYGIDGSYGDGTGTAVKQLQQDLGLTADGIYGPSTEEAMSTLNDIKAIVTQNQVEIRRVPGKILDEPIQLAGTDAGTTSSLRTKAAYEAHEHRVTQQQIAALRGELAGVEAALHAVESGEPLDLEQVRAAARDGVDQALDSLEVTVAKSEG